MIKSLQVLLPDVARITAADGNDDELTPVSNSSTATNRGVLIIWRAQLHTCRMRKSLIFQSEERNETLKADRDGQIKSGLHIQIYAEGLMEKRVSVLLIYLIVCQRLASQKTCYRTVCVYVCVRFKKQVAY